MSADNERSGAASDRPDLSWVTADDASGDDLRSLDDIARRAYEKYQARGGEHGRDVEDWLQAEQEATQRQRGTGDVE